MSTVDRCADEVCPTSHATVCPRVGRSGSQRVDQSLAAISASECCPATGFLQRRRQIGCILKFTLPSLSEERLSLIAAETGQMPSILSDLAHAACDGVEASYALRNGQGRRGHINFEPVSM